MKFLKEMMDIRQMMMPAQPKMKDSRMPCGCDHEDHDDHEAEMALGQLRDTMHHCEELMHMIRPGDNLEGWVAAKLTLGHDYFHRVYHYLGNRSENHMHESVEESEYTNEQVKAAIKKVEDKLNGGTTSAMAGMFDETEFAKRVCKHLGCDESELTDDQQDMIANRADRLSVAYSKKVREQ